MREEEWVIFPLRRFITNIKNEPPSEPKMPPSADANHLTKAHISKIISHQNLSRVLDTQLILFG